MLCVILEQGVAPCRTMAAVLVDGVRRDGCGAAPDGGAAGSVGDVHLLAEQLSDQASVRSLGTACAGARELQQRLVELRTDDGIVSKLGRLLGDVGNAVVEHCLLICLAVLRDHGDGLGGADGDALAAAHAVQRRHSHHKLVLVCRLVVTALGLSRSSCQLVGGQLEGTDGSMRAHECALVTANALCSIPLGDVDSGAALLVCRSALLPLAVCICHEGRDRQAVAVHTGNGLHDLTDLLDQLRTAGESLGCGISFGVGPGCGHVHLVDGVNACVNGLPVHLNDVLALLAVALLSCLLHEVDGILDGHDVSQLEECRLQNGVGALAHADLDGLVDGIDGIQLDVVVSDILLCLGVQVLAQLLIGPLAVDHEHAAGLDILDHLHAHVDVSGVVAGHEVSLVDVVGAADGLVAETQVADGHAAGLLGVILEVCLNILVSVVADDLDGVLVCADRTVAAQTPELALLGASSCGDGSGLDFRQRQEGNVVGDAQGETLLGLILLQLLEQSEDGGRRGVLAAQAVTAAGQNDIVQASLTQGSGNIQVQGLAQGAGLLGAVQHSHLLGGLGQDLQQSGGHPGTVQTDLDDTDLLAACVQVVDDFVSNVADGAHSHDHTVSIGCAVVVEQIVVGAQLCVDLGHVLFNNSRQSVVNAVACLTMLEEHVAVLVGAAHLGVLGVQSLLAELLDSLHVAHFLQVGVIPLLDLLVLMRGTEAVEEVQEGNLALDGCQMGDRGQIHDFLHAALDQHCKTGLAACHDVAVITEDVQRLGSNGTCGNIEHAGQLLSSDLVHIGDHQQQALRSGEGGGDSTCTQRAVHSAGSACLRLHLDDLDLVAEDVLLALSGPLVHRVSHRRRGGNGVDGSHVRVGICYMSGSGIAIHGLLCSRHFSSSIQNLVPSARGKRLFTGAGELP